MKVLIICNDQSCSQNLEKKGLNFLDTIHNTEWICNSKDLISMDFNDYNLIILAKSVKGWMTPEIENNFIDFVNNGGSLLVMHLGTIGYKKNCRFSTLLGGIYNHNTSECLVRYQPAQNHELTKEVISYHFIDEHYFVDLIQNDLDVFLYSESDHGVQPAGWRRTQGSGKVTVLTSGHNKSVWESFNNRNLIDNIVKWLTPISVPA